MAAGSGPSRPTTSTRRHVHRPPAAAARAVDVPPLFGLGLPVLRVVPEATDGPDRQLLLVAGAALGLVALGGAVVAAGAGRALRSA
jgi:hypothetical protein